MNIDSTLFVKLFFGISVLVFLATLYIILPAFMYDKRTVLRPELIKTLWGRFRGSFFYKAKNGLQNLKKKVFENKLLKIGTVPILKSAKKKVKIGLYQH